MKDNLSSKVWEECYAGQKGDSIEHGTGEIKYDRVLFKNVNRIFKGGFSGVKILDIGAGRGEDIINFSRCGATGHALDFSSGAFSLLKTNAGALGAKVFCVQANAGMIPYKSGTFDFVYSKGLMEHFKNMNPILGEQARVLKKGGWLLVEIPQKYTLYTLKKRIDIMLGRWKFGYEREYTVDQFRNAFVKYGIRYDRTYGEMIYPDLKLLEKICRIRFPSFLHGVFNAVTEKIEESPAAMYLCVSVGIIGQKI